MRKLLSYIILGTAGLTVSCNNDYLERYPLAELAPENYFRNAQELQSYTNGFYQQLPSALDVYYQNPSQADDEARNTLDDAFRGTRITPGSDGGWSWNQLRRINLYLAYSHQCQDESARRLYDGVARFFRAYFYFEKLVRFGDVPWYENVLDVDDAGLQKARDSRKVVFEKMLEDIDYAIENGRDQKSTTLITKWTALALKSRMCLFEGTFRKYHGLGDWEEVLQKSIDASEQLMSGPYKLRTSSPDKVYHELFVAEEADPNEMILALQYSDAVPLRHSANFYILSASFGRPGMQKSVVDSYLMKDGSRFTDQPGYQTMEFYEETQNRDPRLAQTIRTPGYRRIGSAQDAVPDFSTSVTGYQFSKYVLAASRDNSGQNINSVPVFRFAEILLNYAEAKAELGNLSQADIDRSIKHLRSRVGMPNLNLGTANADPDPYLLGEYPNVGTVDNGNVGVLLEIRRERRIELIKEGHRWRDLLRWKEGGRLAKPFYGMYFPGTGEYDLDRNGTIDLVIYQGNPPTRVPGRQYLRLGEVVLENGTSGRIVNMPDITKVWDERKDYLYPLPLEELTLNRQLTQNPGWDDINR